MKNIDTSRHLLIEGMDSEKQDLLQKSRVMVVGAGGLGTPVINYLAMAGIGHLTIVDFDIVEQSNLHRQTLYTQADVGKLKAVCAKNYIRDRNPFITLTCVSEALDDNKMKELMLKHDLIIDCTDRRAVSYQINDCAIAVNKAVIFANAGEMSGQLFVMIPKAHQSFHSFRSLWSEKDEPKARTLGVMGPIPGVMGSLQALQAIKLLANFSSLESSSLYCVDFHTLAVHKITL